MPYKDRTKRNEYQSKFMRDYRKKERQMINDYKRIKGIPDGRKKKQGAKR